ncbi:MAG TPA: hypothetical protein VKJ47_02505, partial [Candidatus Binatia bacterium]|nr:hypothetical protein [Candidatus Binatia bacterium]
WVGELVESLWRRQLDLPIEEPEDNEYDRRLHALISLELWFRIFHDGGHPKAPGWYPDEDSH